MKRRELDEKMKHIFREEMSQLEPPGTIKEAIDRRLQSGSEGEETEAFDEPLFDEPKASQTVRWSRRVVVVLVAASVLVFGSLIGSSSAKVVEERGYAFVDPDTRDFAELPGILQETDYEDITPVEQFSNGYTFSGVRIHYLQKYDTKSNPVGGPYYGLSMTYEKEGEEAEPELYFSPIDTKFEVEPERIQEVCDWNGVQVYLLKSIYFAMPENWEELITPEQQKLLDSPVSTSGIDPSLSEIEISVHYSYVWEQAGRRYSLSDFHHGKEAVEAEKIIAKEWIEANTAE